MRAKFICNSVSKRRHWDASKGFTYTAQMSPVVNNSPENKEFFEATPNGTLELGMFKDNFFEPGKEYYIDFTPAN